MSNVQPFHEAAPGRYAACLPRKSKVGAICPLASERIKLIPRGEWAAAAAELNRGTGLKPHVKFLLDQDRAGSCATEAAASAVMVDRVARGLPHRLLNPWFVYYHTGGQTDRGDGRSGGSSIDENLAFIREHGIAPMDVWPRERGWRTKPSGQAYQEALAYRIEEFYDVQTIDELVSCLLCGFCVVYGARGHSVLKVAYDLDLNSWGKQWGDGKGFGIWAPVADVEFAYGAWAVRTTKEV